MAASAAAALLDELMGRDRNLAPSEQKNEIHWDDPEVCKYYLCGFCPHELFVNTRADLGPCGKIHDDEFRKEYVKSSRFERMGYEEDFMRFLQGLISDVEKRIRRGHQRLALNSTQGMLNGSVPTAKEEKTQMLTEKINELVNQAEQLGCEGKVEEAQGVMKLCDQLREERRQLETSVTGAQSSDPEKTMEVCGVCSALLVVGDVQQRTDEHLMGKQHAGYARIRAYVEGRKQKKIKSEADEKEAKEAMLAKEREEREKEREKEREERRKREKEREEKEKKDREKERERRRKEERSRSRSRGRRSRSRDRRSRSKDKRSRSKDRRSRSRDRRSRSRDKRRSSSRERRRKSRSRSRHRQRSRSKDRHKSSRHRSRSHSRSRRSRSRGRRSRSKDRGKDSRRRSRSRDRKSRDKVKRSDGRDDKRSRSYDREKEKDRSREERHKKESKEKSSDRHSENGTGEDAAKSEGDTKNDD